MTLSPRDLEHIASLIWGRHWRTDLEDNIHVNQRVIRRWMAGTQAVPAGVIADLEQILRDHLFKLDEAMERFAVGETYG